MISEGALHLSLTVSGKWVTGVELTSTRRTDVSRVMVGLSAEKVLELVPALFSICGTAHTVAALEACEAALGVPVDEAHRAARQLLTALEAIDNHAFQLCVEWARQAGQPPLVEPLRRVRAATQALQRWCFGGGRWATLGGLAVAPRAGPAELLVELEAAVAVLAPLRRVRDWREWSTEGEGPAQAFLSAVRVGGGSLFGLTAAPLLPPLDAAWFDARLVDDEFSARPTLEGTPAESGAVALMARSPELSALLATSGRTLSTRLIARLLHLRSLVEEVSAGAQSLRLAGPAAAPTRETGRGVGVADTARGRLAHAAEFEAGQVVGWRTVAPTEWTFHPLGVVQEALLGAPASDLQRRAGWLVAALDPCVPCTVHVQGA